RIEEVDIEREEHGPLPHFAPDEVRVAFRRERSQLLALDHGETELARGSKIGGSVYGSAHAGHDRSGCGEQALLDGSLEGRAMEVLLAEVRLPRVGVRVELHQCEWAVMLRKHAQLGERDRMVAAEGNGEHSGLDDRCQSLDDLRIRALG